MSQAVQHTALPPSWADLPRLSHFDRHQLYTDIYQGRMCLLSNLARPAACQVFPELADEIFDAYLYHTTFYVKVWLNYDGVLDQFYNDARAEQCGKLRLSKPRREQVRDLLADGARLTRITFELCTAVNSYTTVCIDASQNDVIARNRWECPPEGPNLMSFIDNVFTWFTEDALISSWTSFGLTELEHLAGMFRVVLPPEEDSVFESSSAWMQPIEHFREWTEADGSKLTQAMRKSWRSSQPQRGLRW